MSVAPCIVQQREQGVYQPTETTEGSVFSGFGKNRYALFAKWMGRLAIFAKTRFAKSSNYLLSALLVQRIRKTAHPLSDSLQSSPFYGFISDANSQHHGAQWARSYLDKHPSVRHIRRQASMASLSTNSRISPLSCQSRLSQASPARLSPA